MQSRTVIKTTLLGLLAAGAFGAAAGAGAADQMAKGSMGHGDIAKCYGVNAAYKNDCQSPGHSCAGQDSKARDPQAFVAVPADLCKKLDGDSLSASTTMKHDEMQKQG